MRAKLSWITTKRSGARAVRDVFVEVERLRVGRGTDNEVQLSGLSVALDHAALTRRGLELWIEKVRGDDLRVNGRVVSASSLDEGDVIRIGQHELRVAAPGDVADLVLEIEQMEASSGEAEALAQRTKMGVAGSFPRRAFGWAAALAVAGLGFGWPLAVDRGSGSFDRGHLDRDRPLLERSLASSLSSGPVSASHSNFGDRCNACHVRAFERVPDEACLACHAEIGAHVAAGAVVASATAREHGGELAGSACVDCHDEHRGGATLATFPDSLCAGCHGEDVDAAGAGAVLLLRAVDFATDHPEFRPAVVLEAGTRARTRVSLAEKPKERSGLRFPHDKHLAARLKAPDGEVTLACTDCHAPDPRGTTMRAIEFEKDCRRCHSLAFDARYPERQALHGSPAELVEDLFEFYATQALRGAALDEQAPEVARRRPGRDLTEEERAAVLEWVGEKTARVARFVFDEEGVCADCHTLGREGEEVTVLPVHLVPFEGGSRWLSMALFRHDQHGSAECESCHEARGSGTATDLLLPGIARCRDCHGRGEPRLGKLTSPCTQCHDFHRERFGAMHGDASSSGAGVPAAPATEAGAESGR